METTAIAAAIDADRPISGGSERQIAWAREIRHAYLADVIQRLAENAARHAQAGFEPGSIYYTLTLCGQYVMEGIATGRTSAREWIDERNGGWTHFITRDPRVVAKIIGAPETMHPNALRNYRERCKVTGGALRRAAMIADAVAEVAES